MISFSCPKCKAFLSVDDHQAASKYACPSCGQLMRVPTPSTGVPQTAPQAANFSVNPLRTASAKAPLSSQAQVQYDADRPFVTWSCTYCNVRLKAALEHAGQSIQCPACQHTLPIPDPQAGYAPLGRGAGRGVAAGAPVAGLGLAARGHTGLIVGLAIGMVVLVGVVVGLLVWQPWAGKSMLSEDQIKFLPDNSDFVAAVNVQELMASNAYRKVELAVVRLGGESFKQGEEKMRAEVGLGWSDFSHVLLGGRFNNRPELTAVFRTRQPVQALDLLRKSKHGHSFTDEKVGPYTMYKSQQLAKSGQALAFCVAGDSTIVLGPVDVVRQVLQRNQTPTFSPSLRAAMNQTDFASTTMAAAMGKISAEAQQQMAGGFPGMQNFSEMLKAGLDKNQGGTLEIRVGSDLKLKSLTLCADAATAQDLKSKAEGGKSLVQIMAGLPPGVMDLLNALKFEVQGNNLVTTMTVDVDKIIKMVEDQARVGRF